MTEPQNLYNINDGLYGRGGGPYLDQELAKAAEIKRAKIEGREPDLDNPPVGGESRLVSAEFLVEADRNYNGLPTLESISTADAEEIIATLVADEGSILKANSVIPGDAPVEEDTEVTEEDSELPPEVPVEDELLGSEE